MTKMRNRSDALAYMSGVIEAAKEDGEPIDPDRLAETFNEALAKNGVESDTLKVE